MPHFNLTLEPAQSRVIVLSFNCPRLTFQRNLRNITNGQNLSFKCILLSWVIWFWGLRVIQMFVSSVRCENVRWSHCELGWPVSALTFCWCPRPLWARGSWFLVTAPVSGLRAWADLTPSNTGVRVTTGDQGRGLSGGNLEMVSSEGCQAHRAVTQHGAQPVNISSRDIQFINSIYKIVPIKQKMVSPCQSMSFDWDANNWPGIVSVLPGQGVSPQCQSPTHYRVMAHVMTCYPIYLCDIDQRPGMVAKMDSRCPVLQNMRMRWTGNLTNNLTPTLPLLTSNLDKNMG